MVEAARTMASPAAIWAIVIVAVVALAFWLTAIYLADRSQVRASGRARAATWPVYAGPLARGSMADEQAGEIPEQAAAEQAEARGRHVRDEPATEGETPTRVDVPAQPDAGSGRHAMPTQRTGDADRAERSRAGQGTPEEDQGR